MVGSIPASHCQNIDVPLGKALNPKLPTDLCPGALIGQYNNSAR